MQMSLHHESMADALREVIQSAGGPKAVGERMFPDMPVEPEDEVARLQREFVEASKSLMTMANKIERMQSRVGLKTAA